MIWITRIMVSKGMVTKSKYWISEKNKGPYVSICLPKFLGEFFKVSAVNDRYSGDRFSGNDGFSGTKTP